MKISTLLGVFLLSSVQAATALATTASNPPTDVQIAGNVVCSGSATSPGGIYCTDANPVVAVAAPVAVAPEPINSPAPPVGNTPDPRMPQIKQRYTANLKKWQAKRLQSYTFTLQRSCFCTPDYTTPMLVTVQGGKVASAMTESRAVTLNPDGSEAPPTMVDVKERAMTIDQLFNEIKQAIDNGAATIDVKYDTVWGYPRSISIDLDKRIADEELAFTISGLKPLIGKARQPITKTVISPLPGLVCPMDMKTCPDGSLVGRTAPGCTFAACP